MQRGRISLFVNGTTEICRHSVPLHIYETFCVAQITNISGFVVCPTFTGGPDVCTTGYCEPLFELGSHGFTNYIECQQSQYDPYGPTCHFPEIGGAFFIPNIGATNRECQNKLVVLKPAVAYLDPVSMAVRLILLHAVPAARCFTKSRGCPPWER